MGAERKYNTKWGMSDKLIKTVITKIHVIHNIFFILTFGA